MHNRYHPNAVGPYDVNHGIRKVLAEMPPRRRIDYSKQFGIQTYIPKQPFHLVIKPNT
jgi:hypothetical protein